MAKLLNKNETCNSCLNFQEKLLRTSKSIQEYRFGQAGHVAKYGDILQSSAKGCASCAVIKEAIIALVTRYLPDDKEIFLGIFEKGYPPDQPRFFTIRFVCDNPPRNGWDDHIELYSSPDAPTPWPSIGWKGCRTVEDDPSSPACIDLARRWIEDCISSHPCCCTFKSPLPKRVVDVGSEEVEPRLYLSQKDEIVPYTALSYCWGDFRHITTTKDTLKQRLLGIPISVLPKTFNDAIALTRRLGVRYIWIDSLCIIQDDNLDWENESAKMADIYSNTFVTICADEGKDARAGFLGRRGEGGLSSIKIACPSTADSKGECHYVYARNKVALASMNRRSIRSEVPTVIAHTGAGVSVLDTRGWTFQERLLSPRTLHYTVAEMAFECKKNALCECTRVPQFLGSDRLFKNQIPAFQRDENHMWSKWMDIVENFTRRSLGRDADRLVALSGVAAAMLPFTAKDYICGLWRMRFLEGLLWHVAKIENSHRISSYAPSWSWASVTSPISYFHGGMHSAETDHWAEIVSIKTEKMSTNPYTQARGSAALRGYLGEATIIEASPGQLYVNVDPDHNEDPSSGYIPTLRENDLLNDDFLNDHLPPRALEFRPDVDGQVEAQVADQVFAFIVTKHHRNNINDKRDQTPTCLVLKRSGEETPTAYFRVGLAFPIWGWSWSYYGHPPNWDRHFTFTQVRII